MSSPQQPQVKSNPNSTNQSTQPTLSWETVLKSPRIEKIHVDYVLSHINDAPQVPVEFVYQFASNVKISYPRSIAISGIGAVVGSILALRYAKEGIRYFITTQEVLDANEKSPLYLSKYALESLTKIYQSADVVTLNLGEFEKIKLLLSEGGIYISGLPYELTVQISQLAGFGRLWHFSPIKQKLYVF